VAIEFAGAQNGRVSDPPRVVPLDRYATAEVIENGSEREPWVPTPRQRRSFHAGLVVALLIGTGWFVAGLEQHTRSADRAAVEAVELLADALPGAETLHDGRVGLVLINIGPSAVRVLSARLDASGYHPVTGASQVLGPDGHAALLYNDLAICGPSLLTAPAYTVEVTARTERGTTVRRSVPLSPRAFREVNYGARARCGYVPMEQAFLVQVLRVKAVPGGAIATIRVANDSVLPLGLARLMATNGATLASDLSSGRDLAPLAAPGTEPRWTTLTLRVRATDCDALYAQGAPRGQGVIGPQLSAWLTRDASILETSLNVDRRLTDALRRSCH